MREVQIVDVATVAVQQQDMGPWLISWQLICKHLQEQVTVYPAVGDHSSNLFWEPLTPESLPFKDDHCGTKCPPSIHPASFFYSHTGRRPTDAHKLIYSLLQLISYNKNTLSRFPNCWFCVKFYFSELMKSVNGLTHSKKEQETENSAAFSIHSVQNLF